MKLGKQLERQELAAEATERVAENTRQRPHEKARKSCRTDDEESSTYDLPGVKRGRKRGDQAQGPPAPLPWVPPAHTPSRHVALVHEVLRQKPRQRQKRQGAMQRLLQK